MGGRPSRESWRRARWQLRFLDVIWVVFSLKVIVHIPRLRVDGVEGGSCCPIKSIVPIETADVQPVDNPWESGALADGAVNPNAVWGVLLRWGVIRDGLTITKPHRKVCNRGFLLLEPRRKIAAMRDERVGLVDQVAREWLGWPLGR